MRNLGFRRVVLYGVGSPIVADFESLLLSLKVTKIYGVANHPSASWAGNRVRVFAADELPQVLRKYPTFLPFTGPSVRRGVHLEALKSGFSSFPPLVHPDASVPKTASCRDGVFIGAGAIIGAGSIFREHAFINRGATLGHHNRVEEYATIGPGVVSGGGVVFQAGCSVGLGARILPGVVVGPNSVVGAGAVVTRDVPDGVTVVGVPAQVVGES
jgi:sugar O-acyltransferase (sialic acid O-acetyltransferase NeuD family)